MSDIILYLGYLAIGLSGLCGLFLLVMVMRLHHRMSALEHQAKDEATE